MVLETLGKGLHKAGAVVEAFATVGSAVTAKVVRTGVTVRRRFQRSETTDSILRLPFSQHCQRALLAPQRALETLEPYGKLHLSVSAARDLIPKDDGLVGRSSDPFVEVFVNDEVQGPRSDWKGFTNNPVWNFDTVLDVHSPLSIVRVQVLDRDNFKTNDLIGFVEFCIADLEPNDKVSGWFELRTGHKLVGLAPLRLDTHMSRRDDSQRDSHRGCNRPSTSSRTSRRPLAHTVSAPSLGRAAPVLRRAPCCGMLPNEEPEEDGTHSDGVRESKGVRPNAGEVHMALRLEAEERDEWYAFCLPEPTLQFLPDEHLDLAQLYAKIVETKNFLTSSIKKALCVPLYIATWRSKRLSFTFLVVWWCTWIWPLYFLGLLPLWLALLVHLLRKERWNLSIFWHGDIIPLNPIGYALVASMRDTDAMTAWLVRLLTSRNLFTNETGKLREFAALCFLQGRPTFDFEGLLQEIETHHWVRRGAGRQCPKGHPLFYYGPTQDEHWVCGHSGGCLHPLTNKFKGCVGRYHCSVCNIDICEPCETRKSSHPPAWAERIPSKLLPQALLCWLTRLDALVEAVHKCTEELTESLLVMPFSPDAEGDAAARRIYLRCCGAAFVLLLVVLPLRYVSHEAVGVAFVFSCKALLIMGTTCAMLLRSRTAQSVVTYFRANGDFKRYRARRTESSLHQLWAFFAPDAVGQNGCSGPAAV